jgi:hypothetical protein
MCFSATASFLTAGVTGIVGAATITRVPRAQELPLAAFPLIFSAQQATEGLLWLTLPVAPQGALASELTQLFLLLSLLFWPIYAPFAALTAERKQHRRRIIWACLIAGLVVGIYFLITTIPTAPTACISGAHISYLTGQTPQAIGVLYLIATGGALIASSLRAVSVLGWIVTIGSAVSFFFYWDELVSVWCFFAAGASVVLLAHFEVSRATMKAAQANPG